MLQLLRAACKQAVSEGILERNPTDGIHPPKPTKKREIHVLTREQAGQMMQAAEENPPLAIAFKIQYATGMRGAEVMGLTWENIDLKASVLHVRQVASYTLQGVDLTEPKTRKSIRTIDLPEKLVRDLREYRKWQKEYAMQHRDTWKEQGFLYTYDGNPMPAYHYATGVRRLGRAIGIKVTPHVLRHTHATQLFGAGWNAKDVQERLGHANISITMDIYTHYLPARGKGIAEYVNTIYPT